MPTVYQVLVPGAREYGEQDIHTGNNGNSENVFARAGSFYGLQCWGMVTVGFLFGHLNFWDLREGAATSKFLQRRLWGQGRGEWVQSSDMSLQLRNPIRRVSGQDWQKQPNFPFNSYLAFQGDGQEKPATSVFKKRHFSHGFLFF